MNIGGMELQWIALVQAALHGLVGAMKAVTFLGSEDFYILVMPVLYWCVDAGLGVRVALMLLLSGHLNGILKVAFHQPRPYWVSTQVQPYAAEPSFGLPSGHAMNTLSIWGTAAARLRRSGFTWLCVAVTLLVGLSRVVLAVHFISDVLAGWLLGLLLLALYILLEPRLSRWLGGLALGQQLLLAAGSTLLLIGIGFLPHLLIPQAALPAEWLENASRAGLENAPAPYDASGIFTTAGIWLGMTSGLAILHRRGGLPGAAGFGQRLGRYLVGLVGLVILWYGLGAVFPRGAELLPMLLRLLRYTLVGFWIAAGAPFVFSRLRLAPKIG